MKQILLVALVCSATLARAQERLQMDSTEIVGSQDLPRVLYIVPWQSPERPEIDAPPISSIMERRLEPLERAAFRRKIHYHEAIFSNQTLARPSTN